MTYSDYEYKKLVSKNFIYLELEFNFNKPVSYTNQHCSYVEYGKENRIVRIEYSFRNKTLMCTIINSFKKRIKNTTNGEYSVTIPALMASVHKNISSAQKYMDYMPAKIGLDLSCEKVAELLRYYGSEILSGEKWISWRDIEKSVEK